MKRRFVSGLVAVGVALAAALVPAAPAAAADGPYKIVFAFSSKCMEPSVPSRDSLMSQWTCDGAAFQSWYFDYVSHDAQGTVHWQIRNAQTGKCAYFDRDYVLQGTCATMGWRALWTLTSVGSTGYYRLAAVHLHNTCVTLQGAPNGKANGATVFIGGCGGPTDPKQQYVDLVS